MDPMSAIGLASNILQFIDFGIKFCRGVYEIKSSATGWTEDSTHISVVVGDLKQATDGLCTSVKGHSKHEKELVKLAGNCQDLSVAMAEILRSLKAEHGNPLWSSVRTAWKSTLKQKKIALIERRLAEYRAEIGLRLNLLLYDEQSPIKDRLQQIEQQAIELGNQSGKQMKMQRDHLREILQRLDTMHIDNTATSDLTACRTVIQDIQSSLSMLKLGARQIPRENDILRALYFPSLFHRDDTVGPAVGDTFRWLVEEHDGSSQCSNEIVSQDLTDQDDDLEGDGNSDRSISSTSDHHFLSVDTISQETDEDNMNIHNTLETNSYGSSEGGNSDTLSLDNEHLFFDLPRWDHDEERSLRQKVASRFKDFLRHEHSIFFIYGKAGSGKSTLLKFLSDSENLSVRQCLQEWAGSCRLIFVSVFFWSAGESLQRSLEGLYRSILYQTLRECPEIISQVFERTSGIAGWEGIRLSLLKGALNKLIQISDSHQYRLCLVIDGLDEYEGDRFDQVQLVKDLQDWGRHENIKIICGARPHLEYMRTFIDQEKTIPLHELTRGDIFDQTGGRRLSLGLLDCEITQPEDAALFREAIVQDVTRYSARLDSLFDQMLDNIDPLNREQTEMFLLLTAHNPYNKSLNALSFSWIEDLDHPGFPFQSVMCCYSNAEIERRLELVQNQIRDLTRGMLEIRPTTKSLIHTHIFKNHPFFKNSVEFFHRTFRDYLITRWHDKPAPTIETFMRLALAEVKFSYTMELYSTRNEWLVGPKFSNLNLILIETFKMLSTVPPFQYFEEFERIINSYEELLKSSIQKGQFNLSGYPVIEPHLEMGRPSAKWRLPPADMRPFSFLNFLAWWCSVTSPYLVKRLMESSNLEFPHTSMVHVFITASVNGGRAGRDVVSLCMENGVSPNSKVTVSIFEADRVQGCATVSAWLAILGILTMSYNYLYRDDGRFWETIEQLLEAGAESSVLFLISLTDEGQNVSDGGQDACGSDGEETDIRCLEISELIEIVQPANINALRELLSCHVNRVGKWWNRVANIIPALTSIREPNHAEEARRSYRKSNATDIRSTFEVIAVMTKTYKLNNNFLIQMF